MSEVGGVLLAAGLRYPPPDPAAAVAVRAWLLVALALLAVWVWSRAESWRRGLLGLEDPRTLALLRIGLSAVALAIFLNMLPLADLLWSEEGMFPLVDARRRWGAACLAGYTQTEGFLGPGGWPGFLHFLTHRPTLLVIDAAPTTLRIYLAVMIGALLCFGLGFRTHVAGVVAWFLMLGLYNHNAVYTEGTDTVLRCLWWVLLCSRCDAALGIDAFLRRRRHRLPPDRARRLWGLDLAGHVVAASLALGALLRFTGQPLWPAGLILVGGLALAWRRAARGRGSETWPGTWSETWPGTWPATWPETWNGALQQVPRFPRLLIMAQIAAIYLVTGLEKTGIEWHRGDALYYALNNSHLARFELGSAWLHSLLGPWPFRLATWVARVWEVAFPLVLVGAMLRFEATHADTPWAREEARRWHRGWIGRVAALGAWAALFFMARAAYPGMLALDAHGQRNDPGDELRWLALVWWGVVPLLVAAWYAMGQVRLVWTGPWGRMWRVDRETLRGWLLGRRAWLGVGVIFHLVLAVGLNLGLFPWIMLLAYLAFFEGHELLDRPRGQGAPRSSGPSGAPRVWAPDPGPRLPIPWVVALVAGPAAVVVGTVFGAGWSRAAALVAAASWTLAIFGVPAWSRWRGRARHPLDGPAGVGRGPALMPGPGRRSAAVAFVLVHLVSVAVWLSPSFAPLAAWRVPARRAVAPYVELARLEQGWRMFAPNPPRATTFLRTEVRDAAGVLHRVDDDFYAQRPRVFWINDRRRKMHRRMMGGSKWYLTPWAGAHCRAFAREQGVWPDAVVLTQLRTPISSPELPDRRRDGSEGPRQGRVRRATLRELPCLPRDPEADARREAVRDAQIRARWTAGLRP